MLRYRLATTVGLVAGVLLALSGCSLLPQSQSGPTSAATATPAGAPTTSVADALAGISQWTAEKLTEAFAAIDAKIGANPADYVDVTINSVNVTVKAIDPQKRENVDQYTYQSGGVEVAPVNTMMSDPGAIEMSKFPSDSVNPAVLAQVINSAVKDSGVEDGQITGVTYGKFHADQPEPKITGSVYGPRATKSFEYDVTGKLLTVS